MNERQASGVGSIAEAAPLRAIPHLIIRKISDRVAVFSKLSGNIHVLDPVAGDALQALLRRTSSIGELHAEFSRGLNVEEHPLLLRYLTRLMEQFDELGLIEIGRTES